MVRFRTTERPISNGDPLAQIYMPLDKAVKNMGYIINSFQEKYAQNPVKYAVYKKLARDLTNFSNGIDLLKKSLEHSESVATHSTHNGAKTSRAIISSALRGRRTADSYANMYKPRTKEEIEALKAIADNLKERSSQVIETRDMLKKFGVYQEIQRAGISEKFTETAELLYKGYQAATDLNLKGTSRN